MRDRLIGPKTWDEIVGIFLEFLEPIWTVRDCVRAVWGVCFIIYEINCVGVYEAGNGHGFWVHKVEPMLDDWSETVT